MEQQKIQQWNMFIHLAQFAGYVIPVGGIIVPVVLWQLKKNESEEIDAHGRMVVNVLLSFLIYWIIAGLLCLLVVGFLILPVLGVLSIVFPIIGAVKAGDGELWEYPGVIRFF